MFKKLNRETKITLHQAELFLDEHTKLSKAVSKTSKSGTDDPKGVQEFIKNNYNSFLFSKECMLELIEKEAEYVLVALGAHDRDRTVDGKYFKKGSFTVMTIGYKKSSNGLNKLIPIDDAHPGYEYPPKYIVENLDLIGNNPLEGSDVSIDDIIGIDGTSLIITVP